tara:strand:- start:4693 stop:5100 length:408 start_codon:yes stop_codon:yes gene_type:complete
MAGENALPISECPDSICSVMCKTFDAGTTTDNTGPWFYCERDTIIDAAFAVSNDADADLTFDVKHAPSGTAVASATSVLSAVMAVTTADTTVTGSLTTTTNLVPAGSWVFIVVAGTADDTTAVASVQVRCRTRIR